MTEFKAGDKVQIGHSDMHAYIVRRPTKEEFPGMLEAYVKNLDKDAAGYITLEKSWVIRIPVQEDWDKETTELEEEVVLWTPIGDPVHCTSCDWTGTRKHGPLKPCPKCNEVVVWTFRR